MTGAEVLEAYGIEEEDFTNVLAETLEEMIPARHGPSGSDLTAHELEILSEGGFQVDPEPGRPIALADTATQYAAMKATALSVGDAAELLGVDPTRVRHRLRDRSLYGIRQRGGWLLPRWQFTDHGVVPSLETVLQALPKNRHPVAVWAFMTTPVPGLGPDEEPATPLEWLSSGGPPDVIAELAETLDFTL